MIPTVSVGQESKCGLAECLWLRVSHRIAVELSATAGPPQGRTRGQSICKFTHVEVAGITWGSSRHGSWLPPSKDSERLRKIEKEIEKEGEIEGDRGRERENQQDISHHHFIT